MGIPLITEFILRSKQVINQSIVKLVLEKLIRMNDHRNSIPNQINELPRVPAPYMKTYYVSYKLDGNSNT